MNGFKVCQIDTAIRLVPTYSRRDFYTVCLLTGPRQVQCADQKIELTGTSLCFGDVPGMGGGGPGRAARHTGYSCRFTEAFFKQSSPVVRPAQWSLFHRHVPRAFALEAEQAAYLTSLFQKMLAEQQTPYLFRHELLRSYLQLVIHEALRLRTPAPKRLFRYYCQQADLGGGLSAGWRSRRLPRRA